jgi:pyrimidine deaminase RibD-like protein
VSDDGWLLQAVELAKRCPPSDSAYSVGAIVVDRHGRELARGFSRESDLTVHAEEAALAKVAAGDPRLAGATLYSTLEPCAERRSRPLTCAQLILDRGIGRVVMAWPEPTLLVGDPRGREVLAAAGVEVIERPGIAAPYYGERHDAGSD